MSESTNYLFAASFSTLERPTSKLLSHRFTSSIIPAGQMLSPYELTGEYEAVDFYSNKPLNLEKPKPQGGLATIKNVWTTMSFKGAVKQSGSHIKPSKAHRKYLNSLPKPEKSKYEIIRYELKPKLNFVLEPRLWYPVEHAWQIYNYDRTYLSSPQIERLEQLQRERDYALGMMRDGHRSYWSMVRDAEIGMFGESPDFGTRPKEGRFTPRLGRGRAELKSYRVERGKSARLLAADGFKRRVVVSIWDNDTRVDGAPPAENNTLAIPHIYGQVLDAITEETETPDAPLNPPPPPSTTTKPKSIRKRMLRISKGTTIPAAPAFVTAISDPLTESLRKISLRKRGSMDSGFAEAQCVIPPSTSKVPEVPPVPAEFDTKSIGIVTLGLPVQDHEEPEEVEVIEGAIAHPPRCNIGFTTGDYSSRYQPFEATLSRVTSAVDKAAAGFRRRSSDSLQRVCKIRRVKSVPGILEVQEEQEEEIGVPLFKPWSIGEQSIVGYRNPRKWAMFVRDRFRRDRVG